MDSYLSEHPQNADTVGLENPCVFKNAKIIVMSLKRNVGSEPHYDVGHYLITVALALS